MGGDPREVGNKKALNIFLSSNSFAVAFIHTGLMRPNSTASGTETKPKHTSHVTAGAMIFVAALILG